MSQDNLYSLFPFLIIIKAAIVGIVNKIAINIPIDVKSSTNSFVSSHAFGKIVKKSSPVKSSIVPIAKLYFPL